MKTTLSYEFEEGDREAFEIYKQGSNPYHALCDLRQELRKKYKHSDDQNTTWSEVQDLFFEILKNNDVEIW